MTLYTRRGDDGTTSLVGGARVPKDDARVEAYGALDEAGALLGLARLALTDARVAEVLRFAQQRLMNVSSVLATPPGAAETGALVPTDADIAAIEGAIDELTARTPEMRTFVLCGGPEAAARLQVARAVIRRSERRVTTLARTEPLPEAVARFLNRLSDLLFIAARAETHACGSAEECWDPAAEPPVG